MVHEVANVEDFKKQLKDAGDKLVVVDFFATWCEACREIAPVLEQIAQQSPNVVVLKVDDDNIQIQKLKTEYSVRSMPTFVFIKRGEKLYSYSDSDEDKLRKTVAKYSK